MLLFVFFYSYLRGLIYVLHLCIASSTGKLTLAIVFVVGDIHIVAFLQTLSSKKHFLLFHDAHFPAGSLSIDAADISGCDCFRFRNTL